MEAMIELFIPGVPQPGGSKKHFVLRRRDGSFVTRPNGAPIVNVTDDGKHNAEWKQAVKFFIHQAYEGAPLTGPLFVEFHFVMPRLKSHFNARGELRPSAPRFHTVKPDATKLVRSTEDAATKLLWLDDAQIAMQFPTKRYGDRPGCTIRIHQLNNETSEIPDAAKVAAPLFALT